MIGQGAYQVKLHYFNTLHFINGHLISYSFHWIYINEDLVSSPDPTLSQGVHGLGMRLMKTLHVLLLWLPACEAVLLLAKDKMVT